MDSATIETLYKKFAEAIPGEKQILTAKQVPDMPSHGFMAMVEGQWQWKELPAAPSQHNAEDVSTLVAIGKKRAAEDLGEIWCDSNEVTLTFDTVNKPNDYVKLTYSFTAQTDLISSWDDSGNGVALSQPELVLLLRTTLYGCYGSYPNLLKSARKVDSKKVQEATGIVERSKASISKSLLAEVSGMDDIPDVIEFEFPIHQERKFKTKVKVAFEFDAHAERFKLVPLPGELTRALIEARNNIGTEIADEQAAQGTAFPVYYGRP